MVCRFLLIYIYIYVCFSLCEMQEPPQDRHLQHVPSAPTEWATYIGTCEDAAHHATACHNLDWPDSSWQILGIQNCAVHAIEI